MKIIRSYPDGSIDTHSGLSTALAHVEDGLPRLYINNHDYQALRFIGDDVLLLEWDIATSIESLQRFIDKAKHEPQRVRVAPYKLYRGTVNKGQYCAFKYNPPGASTDIKWCTEDDATCHLFGFGMTYLPKWAIDGFFAQWNGKDQVTDGTFSRWYHTQITPDETPIDWDCAPVHLNYDLGRINA